MIFEEKDLRQWLRDTWPKERLLWVEAARGGTNGYPDVTILMGAGKCVFAELKAAEIGKDGAWKYVVRPRQKAVLRALRDAGMQVLLIVGNGNEIAFLPITEENLRGKVFVERVRGGNVITSVPSAPVAKNQCDLLGKILENAGTVPRRGRSVRGASLAIAKR